MKAYDVFIRKEQRAATKYHKGQNYQTNIKDWYQLTEFDVFTKQTTFRSCLLTQVLPMVHQKPQNVKLFCIH